MAYSEGFTILIHRTVLAPYSYIVLVLGMSYTWYEQVRDIHNSSCGSHSLGRLSFSKQGQLEKKGANITSPLNQKTTNQYKEMMV